MSDSVKLSVIIPTLNEYAHLEDLIRSIEVLEDTEMEIILVDGGSTDGTYEKALALKEDNNRLEVVLNTEKYVSQGFNKAYHIARGSYIALIGAHAIYPTKYFSTCIEAIESGACEVAGGRLIHEGKTNLGKAISQCMSARFGVGNTAFRTSDKLQYVDSVAFAVYSRHVFEKVGLFDEELVRNQDDEFHYRINAAGMRMLMLPELQPVYFVRETLPGLFKQYFQYGYFKPLVLKKVRSGIRIRHLVPATFVLYLLSLLWLPSYEIWYVPVLCYILLDFVFSILSKNPWKIRVHMSLLFPLIHIGYGIGFILGLGKFFEVKKVK